jgi:hypothetical protein
MAARLQVQIPPLVPFIKIGTPQDDAPEDIYYDSTEAAEPVP